MNSYSRGLTTCTAGIAVHVQPCCGTTWHSYEIRWAVTTAKPNSPGDSGQSGTARGRTADLLLRGNRQAVSISFLAIIESVHVKTLRLPARSPNLNAYSERWVRSAKEECLSKLILFGERSLRRAMREYVAHCHPERNHQGRSNVLLFHQITETRWGKAVECRERLGRLLCYYHRDAA
jgi:hypothetical protein